MPRRPEFESLRKMVELQLLQGKTAFPQSGWGQKLVVRIRNGLRRPYHWDKKYHQSAAANCQHVEPKSSLSFRPDFPENRGWRMESLHAGVWKSKEFKDATPKKWSFLQLYKQELKLPALFFIKWRLKTELFVFFVFFFALYRRLWIIVYQRHKCIFQVFFFLNLDWLLDYVALLLLIPSLIFFKKFLEVVLCRFVGLSWRNGRVIDFLRNHVGADVFVFSRSDGSVDCFRNAALSFWSRFPELILVINALLPVEKSPVHL